MRHRLRFLSFCFYNREISIMALFVFIKTGRQEFPETISKVCHQCAALENIVSLFLSRKYIKQRLGMIILPDGKPQSNLA